MNIFVTPFQFCTTNALVHLKVLTSQAAYHREVLSIYVDSTLVFTNNIYSLFIECDVPNRFEQVASQQLRHVDKVIQRVLQYFLPRLQG